MKINGEECLDDVINNCKKIGCTDKKEFVRKTTEPNVFVCACRERCTEQDSKYLDMHPDEKLGFTLPSDKHEYFGRLPKCLKYSVNDEKETKNEVIYSN